MNLTLDIGNTSIKWATFEGKTLKDSGRWTMGDTAANSFQNEWNKLKEDCEQEIACASGDISTLGITPTLLNHHTPLPIKLNYRTPETLGADRVASACGAWALNPGKDTLIIDAGTCITVDFLSSEGIYHGGAIMPGLKINLQALHTFTAKLPLVSFNRETHVPLLGRTTEESILAGTLGATMLALAGFVTAYRQRCPSLQVVLTGGDADQLLAAGNNGWDYQPHLTLIGLNEILINLHK